MKLASTAPRGELSSIGYRLANPGGEYLVYQPEEGSFRVQFALGEIAEFSVEWFDPKTGVATQGERVQATGEMTFSPPFAGDAVLYLKAVDSPREKSGE